MPKILEPVIDRKAFNTRYSETDRIMAVLPGLMRLATKQAVKGALRHGIDMPVGAAAAIGKVNMLTGWGFASDQRTGDDWVHAEWMALGSASTYDPDSLGVSMEPCPRCQRRIASESSIEVVAFNITREEVARRGLVRAHGSSVFDNLENLPYEVIHYAGDPEVNEVNSAILDHTNRDLESGVVTVDQCGLVRTLSGLGLAREFIEPSDLDRLYPI